MKILFHGLLSAAVIVTANPIIASAVNLFKVTFDSTGSFLFSGLDSLQVPLTLGSAKIHDSIGLRGEFDATDIESFDLSSSRLVFSSDISISIADVGLFVPLEFALEALSSPPSASFSTSENIADDGTSASLTEFSTLAQTAASSTVPLSPELPPHTSASPRASSIGESILGDVASAAPTSSAAQVAVVSTVPLPPELVAIVSASTLADFIGGSTLGDITAANLTQSSTQAAATSTILFSPGFVVEISENILLETININPDGDFLGDGSPAVIVNVGNESGPRREPPLPVFITFDFNDAEAALGSVSLTAVNGEGKAVPEPAGIAGLAIAGFTMVGLKLKRRAKANRS